MRSSIALLVLLAAPAAAQPGLATPEPPPMVQEREWYGYWTLATDAAAIAVGSGSIEGGLATYALGGPLVHIAKQNYVGAGLSLAARVGIPLAFGLMGRRTDEAEPPSDHSYGISEEGAGIIVGIALASILDAALIARRTVAVPAWTVSLSTSHGVAVGVGRVW